MEYFELIKGFVLSPAETFRKATDTDYGETIAYFPVLVLISTSLFIPVMLLSLSSIGTVFGGMAGSLGTGTLAGFLSMGLSEAHLGCTPRIGTVHSPFLPSGIR